MLLSSGDEAMYLGTRLEVVLEDTEMLFLVSQRL